MIWAALFWGCSGDDPATDVQPLLLSEMMDPEACVECHPTHFAQWSGSMHAYAADDPVFLAMNAKGQRETDGSLGDFCLQCHAPLAVQLGIITDGSNLGELPQHVKGVTCYFCHQVTDVEGTHNAPLTLAFDRTMRGGFADPVPNRAHPSAYSPFLDRNSPESSELCGSCHDIVTPSGVHIERTYVEWQESLFAKPLFGLNCGSCHMGGTNGVAAEAEGVPLRRIHDHAMPGVDVATTPWPELDAQRSLVQEFLDDSLQAFLCVAPPTAPPTLAVLTLENVAAGHRFPSGATSDRRVWVEVVAYEGDTEVWSTGKIADDERFDAVADADTWSLHTTLLDAQGEVTHDFWDAAQLNGVEAPLPVQTTLDASDPAYVQTHQSRNILIREGVPDRIEAVVKVRPIGLDVIDDLIASGDLDPVLRDAMPTFALESTRLVWTPEVTVNSGSLACVPDIPPPTSGTGRAAGR